MTSKITMTEGAIAAARVFKLENETYRDQCLRVYLSGKGCDGFEYGVSFDSSQDGDHIIQIADDITLLCDARSIEFVVNSSIEWVDDERGRGFLVNNPNHKKFRGKFYKKPAWKDRLTSAPMPKPSEHSEKLT